MATGPKRIDLANQHGSPLPVPWNIGQIRLTDKQHRQLAPQASWSGAPAAAPPTSRSRDVAARIATVRDERPTRKAQAIAWIAATATEPQLRPWGFVWLNETKHGAADPAEAMMRKMREHATRLCTSGPQLEERVLPLLGGDPPRWNPPDRGQE